MFININTVSKEEIQKMEDKKIYASYENNTYDLEIFREGKKILIKYSNGEETKYLKVIL